MKWLKRSKWTIFTRESSGVRANGLWDGAGSRDVSLHGGGGGVSWFDDVFEDKDASTARG